MTTAVRNRSRGSAVRTGPAADRRRKPKPKPKPKLKPELDSELGPELGSDIAYGTEPDPDIRIRGTAGAEAAARVTTQRTAGEASSAPTGAP
jgi:hypothetical protein